jgi:putative transcriptional regulator
MMPKPKVDLEMAQFQANLLPSVREMRAGTLARSTQVPVTEALQARAKMDLSQSQFAKLLGVSVRTLQGAGPQKAYGCCADAAARGGANTAGFA